MTTEGGKHMLKRHFSLAAGKSWFNKKNKIIFVPKTIFNGNKNTKISSIRNGTASDPAGQSY